MSSAGTVYAHPVITRVRSAADGLDKASGSEMWQLCDTDVETALAGLLDLEARTAALRGVLLREAATRDLKARTRASSLQRWLGDRFRLSRADATTRERDAALFGRHPLVEAALGSGTVTVEQATVTATALDRIAGLPGLTDGDRDAAAGFLLAQCASLTPRDLARAGHAILEALTVTPSTDDPDDADAVHREQQRAEAEAQAAERNDLQVIRRRGRVRAILDLGPLGEATLLAWLSRTDKPHPGTDGFEDHRTRSERRADTLIDLLAAAATGTNPTPPGDSETNDTTVGDATDDCDDGGSGDDDGESARGPVSPLALLTVTTTLAELRAGLTGAGGLDTGATLSAATLRQLACDALLVPAVLGGPAQVLDLGRTTRQWNRAQRRAAALRDRGCIAPGCTAPPAACQLHHNRHWTDGGPTDLDNGALLCGFHHRMVHRQGWAVTLAANGYPQLTPPASIDPDQRPRQHHRFRLTLLTGRNRH